MAERFNKIEISAWDTYVEPVYAWVFKRFSKSIRHRRNILSTGNSRFESELEVSDLLSKIRKTHDLWNLILTD